ncbi:MULTISPECIES: Yip1 family protein [unclassified Leeuwenhoekiella]|uniref:Yip1 family protein n=1 Tax=unclassified Leeuwenhoekiella TaxID=2615029 RepID=UPI000C4B23A9|nr:MULTISPECIES: Yip1 family protein [unclassified Leeuwenhoekiella]MAW93625.1 hypothetical protein [Leeuwenhoekiella sp.]MBA80368.1 hypothetical protein [Leeuwenhoekiella sp.]|tara:strand:- start:12970 stop:13623 length:654 start_codon:yes stop_codon:yes gene_type:complete
MNTPSTPDQNLEHFTDRELFTKIWIHPRKVFRFIEAKKYDKFVYILLVLAGIVRGFDRAIDKNLGDKFSLIAILGLGIIVGGLFGWISYYIYAALLSWTGKWIGGRTDTRALLRVLAYGSIPSIIALIFFIPQIGIYGIELFRENGDLIEGTLIENMAFWGAVFLEMILAIWTLVLIIIGTAEVQNISIANAILNLLLPIIVIVLPILIIAGIFSVL